MREFSVPPIVTVGDSANLTDPVWENAEVAPDVVQFIRAGADGASTDVTCRQFRDEVVAVARGLVAAGVRPGDRVGLMSRTRYEWTLFDYAVWAAGAVTVPIYETSSPEQAAWILSDSGAVAVLVETDAHAALVAGVRDRTPELTNVWQIDLGALDELVTAGESVDPTEIEQRRAAVHADDLATLVYTSGTTGRPKGCMLTHRSMLADVANAVPVLPNLFGPGASTLLFLPLAHAFARLIQVGVVQARATMAHCPDTNDLLSRLQTVRPTFVLSVPRVFEKVYNSAKQKADASGKGRIFARAEAVAIAYSESLETSSGPGLALRVQHALFDRLVYRKLRAALGGRCSDAISGGAPLGARLGHFFRGVGVVIYEGYGLTETSPAASANLPDAIRIGSVGRPLPGVTIRIDDDGEVLIAGDLVFKGYWRNEAASADVLTADGWFRTGDLGRHDAEGNLHIAGRCKELIIHGGFNVYPPEVEAALNDHPQVIQSAVVGRMIEGDEKVVAFVQVAPADAPDPDELRAFAAARLAGYKRPSQIVLATALPAAPTGKILKHKLLDHFADQLD